MEDTMNSVERVKQLCKSRKIPISKLERDLGFSNGYIGQLRKGVFPADRLSKIASYLNVTTEYLLTGQESSSGQTSDPILNSRDERDIAKRLEAALDDLENTQDGLMFSGEPLDDETRELLKASLENSIRIAKINAKQKFTPKKYRKD